MLKKHKPPVVVQCFTLGSRQHIRLVVIGMDFVQLQLFFLKHTSNSMVPKINMYRLVVKAWMLIEMDGTLIVAVDDKLFLV